jgi:hypothetical protein
LVVIIGITLLGAVVGLAGLRGLAARRAAEAAEIAELEAVQKELAEEEMTPAA